MKIELDYDEQCDLVFGRIFRLAAEDKSVLHQSTSDQLIARGLDVSDLGISGEQVEAAFQVIKLQREMVTNAWGIIANAKDWDDETRGEWRDAAELWRNTYM